MIKIAFHNDYVLDLPKGHRFPMDKYDLIPRQLLYEQSFKPENFIKPDRMDISVIKKIHHEEYVRKVQSGILTYREQRRIGFPWSPDLLLREELITYGSVWSTLWAHENGVSFNVAGGTHHAYRDHGEGFCIFNDIAVAAQYLLDHNIAKQIMVVDLDVHQGNGTAHIFSGKPLVFTFSMHGERNYPLRKEISDLDIPLDDGASDSDYLDKLMHYLPKLINRIKPDFVFYQAGVDALNDDKLGKLSLSVQGLKNRDDFVFNTFSKHYIPVAVSMGGGYARRLRDIVEAHCNTFRIAKKIYNN
ncbi:MAG: histone deacetylase [Bacteroidales bacterium]|nr:histone deacetylase [Bacteroidales bacterium]